MVINFTVDTLWGRVVFRKDIPDMHIPDVVSAIFNKKSQPISAELLIDEKFLIESGVTKLQANICVAFHNLLNAIPLIKDGDGSISRESRTAKGIFFPFSESELGAERDNIKFYPLDWAATRESVEKWIEYLQEQGYLELGGNFTVEKINYPVLEGV
jgi:hypothetical protein